MDKNLQKIFDKLLNKNVEMLATDEITGKSADDVIAILEEYDEYIDSMEQPNDDYQRMWNR
jgi:NifU-like protein involved in Fe-S cluster formation